MMHREKQRIIKISGGSVFLSEDYSLPMSCTSLDPNEMRFRPGRNFYWKTEITDFDPLIGGSAPKVLDYNHIGINCFAEQKMKIAEGTYSLKYLTTRQNANSSCEDNIFRDGNIGCWSDWFKVAGSF